jgi:hypothetical protein
MTTGPDGARAFFEREMGDEVDPGHVYLAQADPAFLSAYQQFANVLYGRDAQTARHRVTGGHGATGRNSVFTYGATFATDCRCPRSSRDSRSPPMPPA